MSKMKIDLSQFKHVESNDKTTTLEHKDGHRIILAHGALPKEYKAQFEELAKNAKPKAEQPKKYAQGDMVTKDPVADPLQNVTDPVGTSAPIQDSQLPKAVDPTMAAKWDKYNQYATTNFDPTASHQMQGMTFGPNGEAPKDFNADIWNKASMDIDKHQAAEQTAQIAQQQEMQAKFVKDQAARAAAGLSPLPDQSQPMNATAAMDKTAPSSQFEAPTAAKAGEKAPDLAPAAQQQPSGPNMADPMSMYKSAYQNEMSGVQGKAAAEAQLAKDREAAINANLAKQAEVQNTYQTQFSKLEQERQAHMQDIQDGHIDPNKYWTGTVNKQTGQVEGGHSKIMAGIGMILAGFNPTNNPNAAIKFLDHQMDQNIEAQAKNLDSQNNLLKANLQQFGNLKDATDMTRLMQADIVSNQLAAAAAKAGTPMAKAAAQMAQGEIQAKYAPLAQQMAMRQTMMSLSGGGGGQVANGDTSAAEHMIAMARAMGNNDYANDLQSKLIPGVGLAKIPVPQDVRQEIVGKNTFDKLANHYLQWVNKNAGSLNPAKIAEGATMAAELQGAYRQAIKGGVYKEGEQEFIEKLIPSDPSQFVASMRTTPKIKELIRNNQQGLQTVMQGVGLSAPQSAEPQYKIVNGVKYMRGPDGRAIPVK
jgi:hypothetical protein